MSTHLESLDGPLFTPLAAPAAAQVIGGAADTTNITYIGHCWLEGDIYSDYQFDAEE